MIGTPVMRVSTPTEAAGAGAGSPMATPPSRWEWAACVCCGHKLCKGVPGSVVTATRTAGTQFEILCRGCKTLNYLGARS